MHLVGWEPLCRSAWDEGIKSNVAMEATVIIASGDASGRYRVTFFTQFTNACPWHQYVQIISGSDCVNHIESQVGEESLSLRALA
jgi:hypothetical protein